MAVSGGGIRGNGAALASARGSGAGAGTAGLGCTGRLGDNVRLLTTGAASGSCVGTGSAVRGLETEALCTCGSRRTDVAWRPDEIGGVDFGGVDRTGARTEALWRPTTDSLTFFDAEVSSLRFAEPSGVGSAVASGVGLEGMATAAVLGTGAVLGPGAVLGTSAALLRSAVRSFEVASRPSVAGRIRLTDMTP